MQTEHGRCMILEKLPVVISRALRLRGGAGDEEDEVHGHDDGDTDDSDQDYDPSDEEEEEEDDDPTDEEDDEEEGHDVVPVQQVAVQQMVHAPVVHDSHHCPPFPSINSTTYGDCNCVQSGLWACCKDDNFQFFNDRMQDRYERTFDDELGASEMNFIGTFIASKGTSRGYMESNSHSCDLAGLEA